MQNQSAASLRALRSYLSLFGQWAFELSTVRRMPSADASRLVIIPCDPWTFSGSKGDEAMIQAVCAHARSAEGTEAIAALTATQRADEAAERMGLSPIRAWGDRWRLSHVMDALHRFGPTSAVVIGADVMDGYYDPVTSLRLLLVADSLSRAGVRCGLLGFSFNQSPRPILRSAFNRLHSKVSVNVRDPLSLSRFRGFSQTPAQLVADAAFLLAPETESAPVLEARRWTQDERKQRRTILVVNVHPMLFRDATSEMVMRLNACMIDQLRRFLDDRPEVSLLLLEHDDRGTSGDAVCLAPIADAIRPLLGSHLYYSRRTLRAAEAKACVAIVDGVLTGRMHLAIAALGSGVPVIALTYQDKFQGLFAHFALSDDYLIDPKDLMNGDGLARRLSAFVCNLPALRAQVALSLPNVLSLAARNVEGL